MLPAIHQACAETTGALWSSRTMIVRPFSSVVSLTPGGMAGMLVSVEFIRGSILIIARLPKSHSGSLNFDTGQPCRRSGCFDLPARRHKWFAECLPKLVTAREILAA